MLPVYRALQTKSERAGVSFADVTVFMLDEYVGLSPSDPCSFLGYARTQIGTLLGINSDRLHAPDGASDQPADAAAAYEAAIQGAGGIDLQLLGVGRNGHIGFNEPPAALDSRTRQTHLTESTRADNAACFGAPGAVPLTSITMGVGTILDARKIVLVAVGQAKADAVRAAIEGPVSEYVPASALQLHPDATFIVDAAAAPPSIAEDLGLAV
jgi:glucosamine-6-phosphate deaminase